MGQKKITDLQLISAITDGLNYIVDDGIQSYRSTGLQLKNFILPNEVITLSKLAAEVSRKLVPAGAILKMATSVAPDGFLKANGAAVSRTTYSDLFAALVTSPGFTAQSFTVSLASPAVVTKSGHGFFGGERIRLSTTGALPTGLNNTTDYFVWFIDSNTFRLQTLADVLAGTWVNTSGSQSGTHSYTCSLWGLGDGSTTFNVPDLRGVFDRAWDDSRGLDPSRAIASLQRDAIQNFTGTFNMLPNTAAHNISATGVFGSAVAGVSGVAGSASAGNAIQVNIDASRQARTATETRPLNYALMPVIKY